MIFNMGSAIEGHKIVTGSFVGDGNLIVYTADPANAVNSGSVADGSWSGGQFVKLGFRPKVLFVGSLKAGTYSSGSPYWPAMMVLTEDRSIVYAGLKKDYSPYDTYTNVITYELADDGFYAGWTRYQYSSEMVNADGETYYYIAIG